MRPLQATRRRFLTTSLTAAGGLALSPVGAIAQNDTDRFYLGVHQFSLNKLFDAGEVELSEYAGFAKNELGINAIEYVTDQCGALFDEPVKANAIAAINRKEGVRALGMLCDAKQPIDAADARARRAAVDHHVRWADVTQRLGCDFIRVQVSSEGDRDSQLKHAAAGVSELCQRLSASPVSVLIENVGNHSRDPEWLLQLVKSVGVDQVKLIADFGNFDGDIYAGMAKLLPMAHSVCTKSWEFDSDGNETKIDFRRMMKVVTGSAFSGCISIEYLGDEPVSGIRQTAKLVKKHW